MHVVEDPSNCVPGTATSGLIPLIFNYPQPLPQTSKFFPVAVPVENIITKMETSVTLEKKKSHNSGQRTGVHKSGWKLPIYRSSQEPPVGSQLIWFSGDIGNPEYITHCMYTTAPKGDKEMGKKKHHDFQPSITIAWRNSCGGGMGGGGGPPK